ncbi:MAG TPA: polysaccharide deacetylase family protein [Acidobacteria bacterium]|nr:polysaccharide deacetylase family protein [Acidobacteriota bacterium]
MAEPLSPPRRSWRPAPLLAGSAALHVAGAAALALAPQAWPAICGALFADHVVLAANGLWPQSRGLGPTLSRLPQEAARRGEVALTFDDGPDPEVTPGVLDLLDQAGARASFFCIGRRVAEHPEIAREIARRGHRVENHTWSHPNLFTCYLPSAQRREVERAQEQIAAAAGRRPAFFRAPAGFRNLFLDRELWAAGLTLAAWTRRGFDTVERDPARVAARLLRGLAPGDVLLLHDGSALTDAGNRVTLEALPRVLDGLAARGLRSVPLGGTS